MLHPMNGVYLRSKFLNWEFNLAKKFELLWFRKMHFEIVFYWGQNSIFSIKWYSSITLLDYILMQ